MTATWEISGDGLVMKVLQEVEEQAGKGEAVGGRAAASPRARETGERGDASKPGLNKGRPDEARTTVNL